MVVVVFIFKKNLIFFVCLTHFYLCYIKYRGKGALVEHILLGNNIAGDGLGPAVASYIMNNEFVFVLFLFLVIFPPHFISNLFAPNKSKLIFFFFFFFFNFF